MSGFYFGEGDVKAALTGLGKDHAFQGTAIASLCPRVEIVDDSLAVDSHIEDAQSLVVGSLRGFAAMPGLGEIELNAIGGGICRNRQCPPQAVTAITEALEQRVAPGASDVSCDHSLGCL